MNLLRIWNMFWFRPISARPLGAFRVVIGVLALCHLGLVSVDLDYWLTDQGLLQGSEARMIAGPFRLSPLQWIQDPISVRVFVAATAVVALQFTLGWYTRAASILLYLGLLSIHHRLIPTNCGPDNLLMVIVFYMMFAPCGRAYSLDSRRERHRRGTLAEPIIVPWALRLIQLQLCLIYLDTAIIKCNGTTWLNGTAVHFVLHNPEVGRFDLSFLSRSPILINLMTHIALIGEFALAFLLWFRPTRKLTAFFGIALHAGIVLVVNVPLFGELMTACYLTFLHTDELESLLRFVNPTTYLRSRQRPRAVVPGRVDTPVGLAGPHVLVYEPEEELVAS